MSSLIRHHLNTKAQALAAKAKDQLWSRECDDLARTFKVSTTVVLMARDLVAQEQEQYYGTVKTNAVGSKS